MRLVTHREREQDLTPDQQAVRWLLRARKGKLSAAEQRHFQEWRSVPGHAAAYERAGRLWDAVDVVAATPEILNLRTKVLAEVRRRGVYFAAAMAAGMAVIILVGLASSGRVEPAIDRLRMALSLALAPVEGMFSTTIGERSTVTLRDGSVLTLDTDSAARVAYSDTERVIILIRGQALFEVAKGEPRPFVVYAGDRRIMATGTAFDVRVAESGVEVTLVEGHVHVGQAAGFEAGRPMDRQTELQAGERLIAKGGAAVSIDSTNVERVTSWTAGKLVFLNARLADAVAEANRYTRTPINLADMRLSDLRVNGVFRAGQPAEFARAIAQIYPVAIDYRPDGRIRIVMKAE